MSGDLERIREALAFVDPADRETWLRMAMAVKSEVGDAGFSTWDDWSQGAESYRAADARDVWRSCKGGGKVTIGTLFYEAQSHGWSDTGARTRPTQDELADRRRIAAERAAREQDEIDRKRAVAAKKAAGIWRAAGPAGGNPYLARKGVAPVETLREIEAAAAAEILGYAPQSRGGLLAGRLLVVPIKVGGRLSTLELIDGGGRKHALDGGAKKGGYWASETLPAGDGEGLTLLIGEGVATGLSGRAANGHPAIAALSASNLPAVAKEMRERYPAARLVLLADLVRATGEPDPHAIEAAAAVGGLLAVPDFGPGREPGQTDFNDLHQAAGLEAVARAIEAGQVPAGAQCSPDQSGAPRADSEGLTWPAPQPMTAKIEPEPYPLDALPETIRAAVEEVVVFVQAPVPLVAGSALAVLSLACQAHIDVQRAERLQGPVGLFLLSIADSGERKTTCDGFFASAIRQWEDEQAEAAGPDVARYRADLDAWNAERDGLLSAIKSASARGKDAAKLKHDLAQIQGDKPEPPRVPRSMLGDETPENLAWSLARQWPSAGVLSSEAGLIFGAHGMGKDSVLRNLALLNVLWDGGVHSVGRRTSESFTVRGARLTVGLQVQESALRDFFDRTGPLARGTGFLARFLIAWPESTQGQRPFREAPRNWPSLARFHSHIAEILRAPVPIDEAGGLAPAMLSLTPDAKAAWVEYHDAIEVELSSGRELYDVRDVASKTADNAVRLAALFQMFEGRGAIGADAFEGASRIAAWHLSEARRFFGELALPDELADAARLDSWLIAYCRRERTHLVPKNAARQYGPLRDGKRLDAAVRELCELDRLRLTQDGRRLALKVNPALLEVAP